jgi:hypothetical protein
MERIEPIYSLPAALRAAFVCHEGPLVHVDFDEWGGSNEALELHVLLDHAGIVAAWWTTAIGELMGVCRVGKG